MRTSRILAPEKPPPVHETVAVRNSDRLASVQTRSRTGVIAIRPRPDSIHVEGGGADGADAAGERLRSESDRVAYSAELL